MKVKHRVFTHGIGSFVLSHDKFGIVYLPMKIRAFTHRASCIYTQGLKISLHFQLVERRFRLLTQNLTRLNTHPALWITFAKHTLKKRKPLRG